MEEKGVEELGILKGDRPKDSREMKVKGDKKVEGGQGVMEGKCLT